jgi:hypothetical protein
MPSNVQMAVSLRRGGDSQYGCAEYLGHGAGASQVSRWVMDVSPPIFRAVLKQGKKNVVTVLPHLSNGSASVSDAW